MILDNPSNTKRKPEKLSVLQNKGYVKQKGGTKLSRKILPTSFKRKFMC
nr:MAG TPA: hypothetical protein [Caudoviricetes sp.]